MNSKFYVSYEAARLLKEKGYDRECMAFYQNGEFRPYSLTRSGLSMYNKNAAPEYMNQYSAPTKAEAIDWLERKGMLFEISIDIDECAWIFNIVDKEKFITIGHPKDGEFFTDRLEAEEAAIIKALELLKGKEE